ncbi:hypothetical protein BDW22DRAFT_1353026 [Trametopsis cervina]|nr:hypothetical protein BDW22DRAFT_1353026 [Trametopsis cervina]
MDADDMFPGGFHPVKLNLDPTCTFKATIVPRNRAFVRYYYVDFEYRDQTSDLRYSDGTLRETDAAPPYLSQGPDGIEPDKLEVWVIGQFLKTQFYDVSCRNIRASTV